jgi:hypothetical protein
MSYIKVKDKDNLLRDKNTNAIINSDYQEYLNYQESYKKKLEEKNRIENIEQQINTLKDDLSEIKVLLKELIK